MRDARTPAIPQKRSRTAVSAIGFFAGPTLHERKQRKSALKHVPEKWVPFPIFETSDISDA
jgi:hypothetical protein